VKKIDFFSAEKTAINGVNWHFSALLNVAQRPCRAEWLYLMLSALKKSATQRSGEKEW
jgi:hypothetical protein